MDNVAAIQLMSALAQPTRLAVFLTLARHRPGGLPVGEIAKLVDTPPNTMSSHLSILARAGAVTPSRDGRTVSYTVVPSAVRDLTLFLVGGSLGGTEYVDSSFVKELEKVCSTESD